MNPEPIVWAKDYPKPDYPMYISSQSTVWVLTLKYRHRKFRPHWWSWPFSMWFTKQLSRSMKWKPGQEPKPKATRMLIL